MASLSRIRLFYGILSAFAISVFMALIVSFVFIITMAHEVNDNWLHVFESAIGEGISFIEMLIFVSEITASVALVITLIGIVFLGLPLLFILNNLNLNSLKHYILSGFAIAIVIITIIYASDYFILIDFYYAASSILVTAPMVTAVFWVVIRPDKNNSAIG